MITTTPHVSVNTPHVSVSEFLAGGLGIWILFGCMTAAPFVFLFVVYAAGS